MGNTYCLSCSALFSDDKRVLKIEAHNKNLDGYKISRFLKPVFFVDLSKGGINDKLIPAVCRRINLQKGINVGVNLSGNHITSVGASMLFDTLNTNNSSIKEIHLYDNKQIDNKCMKSLGEYIKSNKNIERISLGCTSISDAGIEILAPYLDGNTTFKALYLTYNKGITDKSIPFLMKMVKSSYIRDVNIEYTLITQRIRIKLPLIFNRIKNGSTSLEFSCQYSEADDDDLIKICDDMKTYGIDKLKEITLSCINITSKGASVLFDTLKECNSVVSKLELSYTRLDDECMKQLGEYLQYNEYVEELRLEDNKITDKGVEILSEHLIGNTTLKELHLYGNKGITDESIPYLVKIIESSHIEYLSVSGTSMTQNQPIIVSLVGNHIKCGLDNLHLHSDISDEDIIKICGYMKEYGIDKLKSIVTRCRIRSNKITSKGASVLFGTLKECNSVAQTVEFRDNLIDNEFMQSLGEYLQDDEHIEILRLTGNEIADEGVEILSQYMIGNTTLKELNLRGNKGITDASIQSLIDAVKSSHMIYIGIYETSISKEKQNEIYEIVKIPINEREIHTKSNTKSAAKIS